VVARWRRRRFDAAATKVVISVAKTRSAVAHGIVTSMASFAIATLAADAPSPTSHEVTEPITASLAPNMAIAEAFRC
jgi:hypothetical protein